MMNILAEIKSIFKVADMNISERNTVLEISFNLSANLFPNENTLRTILGSIPSRDVTKITFTLDSGDSLIIHGNTDFPHQAYLDISSDICEDTQISTQIEIRKTVKDGTFSIYSFDHFSSDLLSLGIKDMLTVFSRLLKGQNYLVFEIFDGDCFFTTETMAFIPEQGSSFSGNFTRLSRLDSCNNASNFYNKHDFDLLPDDFAIKINCNNNPLAKIFNRACAILSLAYLSTSASIRNDTELKLQIVGHRTLEYSYPLATLEPNQEFYKIYSWIYTDGNASDKSLIARNIISLHCRYSELGDIDEKTLSSIQSNYNIYLKENVSQYIELKNKLAEFICDVVSKTGDYATMLLSDLKKNLIAIFGFLFTVILANIVSSQPLENIFTRDITIILEVVLAGSIIYLFICNMEAQYKLKKATASYQLLKKNYDSILSDIDLEEIFDNDNLLNDTIKSVKRGIWIYTLIWLALLVCILMTLEKISCSPIVTPYLSALYTKFTSCQWIVSLKHLLHKFIL